jgi:hypothetical protein
MLRAQAQTDSSFGVFERMANEAKNYRIDTSAVPQDKLTRKIIEFRELRGGFNINEAIRYKMEEEEKKDPNNPQIAYLKQQFASGFGKQWLDNATIWIYRQQFSYREMKKLVKFYKTGAGRKLGETLPVNMIKTTIAAEIIQKALLARK